MPNKTNARCRRSADAWRATPHRVLCPPAGVVSDRLTLGFFFRPSCDTVLALPPSATAGGCGADADVEETDCSDGTGDGAATPPTAAPRERVEYEAVTAAEFIALPKGERLSTTVSPEGACIYTPLSAQRISAPS